MFGREMVSISRKREDLKAIDPTRDVNYLAERILKEEAVVARSPAADRKPKRGLTPQLVAKLLPKDMRVRVFCVPCACVCITIAWRYLYSPSHVLYWLSQDWYTDYGGPAVS